MSFSAYPSITSVDNTTTSPLGAGATFTGIAELNPAPWVGVSCKSDTVGTLYFDFSVDGTNYETFPTNGFGVAAGIHEFHTALKLGRYFRVRFVNGASAQSTFRLTTYFGIFDQPIAPLNQPLGLDSDAILTRSTFPWLDAARGLSGGLTTIAKFGRNESVGTNYEPVCLGGVYQTPQAASATALRVKSGGNANDTAAGTGGRQITIEGLDENFEQVSETIATAGASASSATTTTFTRLYRAYVSESGTYATLAAGSHAGDIVIENSGGGTDWATISVTDFPKSQTEIGAYSIAAGKTGYVQLRDCTIDSGKTVDLIFFARGNIDDTAAPYSAMRAQSVVKGLEGGTIQGFGGTVVPFGPYTGPTDIGFMAKTTAGTAEVSVEFEIFVLDE